MTTDSVNDLPGSTQQSESGESEVDAWTSASEWYGAFRSRIHLVTELAMAEAKLAASSLAVIIAIGVTISILAMSAWGLLIAGIVTLIVSSGTPLWIALPVVAVIQIVLAIFLARKASAMRSDLEFRETRLQLAGEPIGDDS